MTSRIRIDCSSDSNTFSLLQKNSRRNTPQTSFKPSFIEVSIWQSRRSLCWDANILIPQIFLLEKLSSFAKENQIQNAGLKQHLDRVCLAVHIWSSVLFLLDSPDGTGDQAYIQVQTCSLQLNFVHEWNLSLLLVTQC